MHSQVTRLLISSLAAALLAACQADEEKLAEHMSRGVEYFEAEDYAAAIIEYKNVLQIDPNDATAHYGLAKAFLRSKKAREGFWELRETVRLDETNIEARIQLGQILVIAGDPEEALKHADQIIAASETEPAGYVVRGQALAALKRPDEAIETFRKGVEMAPEETGPLYMLAHALNRRGDREEAEPNFRKFVELDTGFRSYTALGSFLAQDRDRDDEAEAAFIEAAKLAEPADEPKAHAHVASFYFQRERYDEATQHLETAIQQVEDPLDLIYLLARLELAQGNEDRADELIEEATRAVPNDPKPQLILSAYRGRKGDVVGAMAAAERAVEIDPEHTNANLRLAEILVDVGYREDEQEKIDRGREITMSVLEKEPSHPSALMIKAKIDLAEQQIDDAIVSLRAAIDVEPELAQAHYILGTALSLKGERHAARTELARTLEIDASMLEARRVLARVHAMLGEHEYAVEEGQRFLRERPENKQTRIMVAQSLVILGRDKEALAELAQITEEDRTPEVLYALGRVHLRAGRNAEAREYLNAAIEQMPTNHDILRNLLRLDRKEGRFSESVERINVAVEKDPESAKLRMLLGVVALIDNRLDDAETAFKKAVEIDPDDVAGYEHLARLFSRTGRLDEAVTTYEDAVKVHPDNANLHHFLGILYQYGGAREKAIARYEDAVKYDPDLAEAKNNLAYIYADSGENLDRALDLAQEAKAALPDSANAADTLGWVLYKRGIPSAAISYLKEAEAGKESDDATVGVIRHHLAQAYDADGEPGQAEETLRRALKDLDARAEATRAQGGKALPEPGWAQEARSMLARLQSGAGAG